MGRYNDDNVLTKIRMFSRQDIRESARKPKGFRQGPKRARKLKPQRTKYFIRVGTNVQVNVGGASDKWRPGVVKRTEEQMFDTKYYVKLDGYEQEKLDGYDVRCLIERLQPPCRNHDKCGNYAHFSDRDEKGNPIWLPYCKWCQKVEKQRRIQTALNSIPELRGVIPGGQKPPLFRF